MREFSSSQHNNITSAEKKGMELSLMAAQHFPAVSGALMDTPHNGNASLQTSTSNLNAKPVDPADEPKYSTDAIWLWVAVIATVSNIVVVAVISIAPLCSVVKPAEGLKPSACVFLQEFGNRAVVFFWP